MFEYSPAEKSCRFLPHTRLKQEYFPQVAVRESNDTLDVSVFVLQCSVSQENVLDGNEWTMEDVSLETLFSGKNSGWIFFLFIFRRPSWTSGSCSTTARSTWSTGTKASCPSSRPRSAATRPSCRPPAPT